MREMTPPCDMYGPLDKIRDIIAGNGCQFNPRTSESNYGAGYGECTAGNLGATVAVPTEPPPGNKVWLLKGFARCGRRITGVGNAL